MDGSARRDMGVVGVEARGVRRLRGLELRGRMSRFLFFPTNGTTKLSNHISGTNLYIQPRQEVMEEATEPRGTVITSSAIGFELVPQTPGGGQGFGERRKESGSTTGQSLHMDETCKSSSARTRSRGDLRTVQGAYDWLRAKGTILWDERILLRL